MLICHPVILISNTILGIENDLNLSSHQSQRKKDQIVNTIYVPKILLPGPRTWPFWLLWQIHFDFPGRCLRICNSDNIQISDYFTILVYLDYILPKQNFVCTLAAKIRYLQRENFLAGKLVSSFPLKLFWSSWIWIIWHWFICQFRIYFILFFSIYFY